MAAPELAPEQEAAIAQLRTQARYEHLHEKVSVLASELHLDEGSFRRLAKARDWRRGQKIRAPRSPRRWRIETFGQTKPAPSAEPLEAAPPPDIATLVERQLSAIDRILADLHGAHGANPERQARTIASVSRTLKELLRMRAQSPSGPDDDNTMPADIDEFRRDLARRIEAFIASEEDRAVVDPGGTAEA